MANIENAIKQIEIDIEKTHQELIKAYDNNLSSRQYKKLLKALIELNNAKERLEAMKEDN